MSLKLSRCFKCNKQANWYYKCVCPRKLVCINCLWKSNQCQSCHQKYSRYDETQSNYNKLEEKNNSSVGVRYGSRVTQNKQFNRQQSKNPIKKTDNFLSRSRTVNKPTPATSLKTDSQIYKHRHQKVDEMFNKAPDVDSKLNNPRSNKYNYTNSSNTFKLSDSRGEIKNNKVYFNDSNSPFQQKRQLNVRPQHIKLESNCKDNNYQKEVKQQQRSNLNRQTQIKKFYTSNERNQLENKTNTHQQKLTVTQLQNQHKDLPSTQPNYHKGNNPTKTSQTHHFQQNPYQNSYLNQPPTKNLTEAQQIELIKRDLPKKGGYVDIHCNRIYRLYELSMAIDSTDATSGYVRLPQCQCTYKKSFLKGLLEDQCLVCAQYVKILSYSKYELRNGFFVCIDCEVNVERMQEHIQNYIKPLLYKCATCQRSPPVKKNKNQMHQTEESKGSDELMLCINCYRNTKFFQQQYKKNHEIQLQNEQRRIRRQLQQQQRQKQRQRQRKLQQQIQAQRQRQYEQDLQRKVKERQNLQLRSVRKYGINRCGVCDKEIFYQGSLAEVGGMVICFQCKSKNLQFFRSSDSKIKKDTNKLKQETINQRVLGAKEQQGTQQVQEKWNQRDQKDNRSNQRLDQFGYQTGEKKQSSITQLKGYKYQAQYQNRKQFEKNQQLINQRRIEKQLSIPNIPNNNQQEQNISEYPQGERQLNKLNCKQDDFNNFNQSFPINSKSIIVSEQFSRQGEKVWSPSQSSRQQKKQQKLQLPKYSFSQGNEQNGRMLKTYIQETCHQCCGKIRIMDHLGIKNENGLILCKHCMNSQLMAMKEQQCNSLMTSKKQQMEEAVKTQTCHEKNVNNNESTSNNERTVKAEEKMEEATKQQQNSRINFQKQSKIIEQSPSSSEMIEGSSHSKDKQVVAKKQIQAQQKQRSYESLNYTLKLVDSVQQRKLEVLQIKDEKSSMNNYIQQAPLIYQNHDSQQNNHSEKLPNHSQILPNHCEMLPTQQPVTGVSIQMPQQTSPLNLIRKNPQEHSSENSSPKEYDANANLRQDIISGQIKQQNIVEVKDSLEYNQKKAEYSTVLTPSMKEDSLHEISINERYKGLDMKPERDNSYSGASNGQKILGQQFSISQHQPQQLLFQVNTSKIHQKQDDQKGDNDVSRQVSQMQIKDLVSYIEGSGSSKRLDENVKQSVGSEDNEQIVKNVKLQITVELPQGQFQDSELVNCLQCQYMIEKNNAFCVASKEQHQNQQKNKLYMCQICFHNQYYQVKLAQEKARKSKITDNRTRYGALSMGKDKKMPVVREQSVMRGSTVRNQDKVEEKKPSSKQFAEKLLQDSLNPVSVKKQSPITKVVQQYGIGRATDFQKKKFQQSKLKKSQPIGRNNFSDIYTKNIDHSQPVNSFVGKELSLSQNVIAKRQPQQPTKKVKQTTIEKHVCLACKKQEIDLGFGKYCLNCYSKQR